MLEEWSPLRTSRFGGSKNHFHVQLKSALPMGFPLSSVKTWPNFFTNCIPSLIRVELFYYKLSFFFLFMSFLIYVSFYSEGKALHSSPPAEQHLLAHFPLSTSLSLLGFGLWLSSHPQLPLIPVSRQLPGYSTLLILLSVHSSFHSSLSSLHVSGQTTHTFPWQLFMAIKANVSLLIVWNFCSSPGWGQEIDDSLKCEEQSPVLF